MADLRRQLAQPSPLRLIDAVASGTNEIDGVAYQAVVPVSAGQRCQLLKQGDAPPVILGPLVTDWQTITLADANWTQTRPPQWRLNGGRVELRGTIVRTTSSVTPGTNLFSLGVSGNPPSPNVRYVVGLPAFIASATPDAVLLACFIEEGTDEFRTSGSTYTVAVGDDLFFDAAWWPA